MVSYERLYLLRVNHQLSFFFSLISNLIFSNFILSLRELESDGGAEVGGGLLPGAGLAARLEFTDSVLLLSPFV